MRRSQFSPRALAVTAITVAFLIMFTTFNSGSWLRSSGLSWSGAASQQEEDPLAVTDFGEPPAEDEVAESDESAVPVPKFFTSDDTNPSLTSWRSNQGVHLITSFFKGTYKNKRVAELLECVRRNVRNPAFEAVHVLWEDANPRLELAAELTPEENARLVTSKVNQQPTYQRFFAYANYVLERGAIGIVANSDLYFDKSVGNLKFGSPGNQSNWRSAMALSRRHAPECGTRNDWKSTYDLCQHYIGSHDAFVFAPPVPEFVLRETKHTQNHFGAENIVVWAFLWSKYFRGHVTNPCLRVHAFHLHCIPERHYQIGSFISRGRHGNVEPGVPAYSEDYWNLIR
jgi:hypothetical protein